MAQGWNRRQRQQDSQEVNRQHQASKQPTPSKNIHNPTHVRLHAYLDGIIKGHTHVYNICELT